MNKKRGNSLERARTFKKLKDEIQSCNTKIKKFTMNQKGLEKLNSML